ncbi:MAG: hypothetical protein LIO44_05395 [Eubacterium sp.]|nr:hypothetical protein [Eubacterium sp.]
MDENEKKEHKFSKEALRQSKLFKEKKDLISAVLENGKEYTTAEAETLINEYLNREVG